MLLFCFELCEDFLEGYWTSRIGVVLVELVIYNHTSPTPGDAWPAFIANKLYTLSVPEDANHFANGCNPKGKSMVELGYFFYRV